MNNEELIQLTAFVIVYTVVSIFVIALFVCFPYAISLDGILVSYWFAILTSIYLFDNIIT